MSQFTCTVFIFDEFPDTFVCPYRCLTNSCWSKPSDQRGVNQALGILGQALKECSILHFENSLSLEV